MTWNTITEQTRRELVAKITLQPMLSYTLELLEAELHVLIFLAQSAPLLKKAVLDFLTQISQSILNYLKPFGHLAPHQDSIFPTIGSQSI